MWSATLLGPVLQPPVWIEMPAIVAGALAGALYAQRRGLDLTGVVALSLVSGLGGGILRDVLLARIPLALRDPKYLLAVAVSAAVGAFFAEVVNRMRHALALIDAVSLGLFSVIGAQGALTVGLPMTSAVLLGTITAIGASVCRDVLMGDLPPRMLRRGAPYASAAFVGTIVYIGLAHGTNSPETLAEVPAVAIVLLIRGISLWRGWESPTARDLTPAFLRKPGREASAEGDGASSEASQARPSSHRGDAVEL